MSARIRPQMALAIALFFGALATFIYSARSFDRSLRDRDVAVAPGVWSASAAGPWTAPLGRFDVPAFGVLRVVACPAPVADPHATLELLDPRTARSLASVALTADESRGDRCFDASYRTRGASSVVARVRFAHAARPPHVATIETSASRRIMPWSIAPVLAMLAAFVLLITAPRRAAAAAPPAAATPPAPPPTEQNPWGAFGGVIPAGMIQPGAPPPTVDPATGALVMADGYRSPATLDLAPAGETQPPVEWRLSWLLALVAYAGSYLFTGVVVAIYLVVTGGRGGAETASMLVVTMLAQHGLLAVIAAAFLGAFDGRRPMREAVGLVAISRRQVAEAVALALGLCAIAAASTHFIHDVSASPMGRMIEHVPVRYAIGFGALLAPLTEELFFRGVLVRAFGKRSRVVGVVAGAIAFTAAHAMQLAGAWVGLVPICAVAVVNGWLRIRSGGITQPWLVHTIYNLVLSAGLYFS